MKSKWLFWLLSSSLIIYESLAYRQIVLPSSSFESISNQVLDGILTLKAGNQSADPADLLSESLKAFPRQIQRQFWADLENPQMESSLQKNCPIVIPPFPDCRFPASIERQSNAKAIHPKLRDFRLSMAVGDSATVGLFIRGGKEAIFRFIAKLPTEDRGFSFPIGGDKRAVTISSNLQKLQPSLIGPGKTRTKAETSPSEVPLDEMNLAVVSTPVDGLQPQMDELISRLKMSKYAPYVSQWKMMHLFAKGINLFSACWTDYLDRETGLNRGSPEFTNLSLDRAIQYLYDNLPRDEEGQHRLFLNIYTIFEDPAAIYDAGKDSFWCRKVQELGQFCVCLYKNDTTRAEINELVKVYNQNTVDLVRKWQRKLARQKDTRFRISVNRAMETIQVRELETDFISPADWYFKIVNPKFILIHYFVVSIPVNVLTG